MMPLVPCDAAKKCPGTVCKDDGCFGFPAVEPVGNIDRCVHLHSLDSRVVIFYLAMKFSNMFILRLLILVISSLKFSFAIAETTDSETDAGSDAQIFDNNELTLPVPDQPLDTFSGNSNRVSGFYPTDPADPIDDDTIADAGAATTGLNTDLDPETVAGEPCPSSENQPSGKLRARNGVCNVLRQSTNQIENPEDGSTPKPQPDETMREFNKRPLAPGYDLHDACARFMGGLFPEAVCSSGDLTDEKVSRHTHPHIPRGQLMSLKHCDPCTFMTYFPPSPNSPWNGEEAVWVR